MVSALLSRLLRSTRSHRWKYNATGWNADSRECVAHCGRDYSAFAFGSSRDLSQKGVGLEFCDGKTSHLVQSSLFTGRRSWSALASEEDKVGLEEEDDGALRGEDSSRGKAEVGALAGGGDAVYTAVTNPLQFSASDINRYYTLSTAERDLCFGEGLPGSVLKEFDASRGSSLLVRTRFLDLCNRLQKHVEDTIPFKLPNARPFPVTRQSQFVLDGPIGSGKSAMLAMLVHWARAKGWLVFYVPNGREWTQNHYYFKNEETGLWDTPVQAKQVLEGFLKSHEAVLRTLPCRIALPLALGRGAGSQDVRGAQQLGLPAGASLRDLVEKGVSVSQASVSALVRLKEELELVENVPVLYAIDEYNSWFTLSRYFESTGERASRQIHAHELTMVHAFRTMETSHLMVAAFSHSTGVGKLPLHLPGLLKRNRFDVPRYTPEEAMITFQYYRRQNILKKDPVESHVKRLFFLTNGNAAEMRKLARLV